MEEDTTHNETLTDSFTRAQAYHHIIIIAQAETFNSTQRTIVFELETESDKSSTQNHI